VSTQAAALIVSEFDEISSYLLLPPDDDVVGGTDDLRRKILHLFHRCYKEFGTKKSWLAPPPLPAPSTPPPSRDRGLIDDQRVAVVEPEEALDLL